MKMNRIRAFVLFAFGLLIFGCASEEQQQTQQAEQADEIQPMTQVWSINENTDNNERDIVSTENKKVKLETSMGDIAIELNEEKAPITVGNFLSYVESGFYNGTIFHRVMSGFMIQGGGFTEDMVQKSTQAPIKNEASNGLSNDRGTIAMARTNDPDSATAQFFINHVDNGFLNYRNPLNPGYAVFGKVVEGMDVVDKIASVATTTRNGMENVPVEPVLINSAEVISQ